MEIKCCSKCKLSKPKEAFCKSSYTSDGRSYHCRDCRSIKSKKHPTRLIFYGMKKRCYDQNCAIFKYYGGRGISICDEWLENPRKFCEWAKVNGYQKGLHIDRIDTDRGYSPDNCRFVTPKINNENLRTSLWWFVNGTRYNSLTDAAKSLGVNRSTVGRWCQGQTYKGVFYPPRKGCYVELKYN